MNITNEITNEVVNEVTEAVEETVANYVVDAVVADEANGIGLLEGTLIVAGGALVVYGVYKAVKWGVGKYKVKKAAKMAAKQEEVVAEVEAEEPEEVEISVEA